MKVNKFKLQLKVTNVAIEAKGTIGLDEYKIKSRFKSEHNTEEWKYEEFSGMIRTEDVKSYVDVSKMLFSGNAFDKMVSCRIKLVDEDAFFLFAVQMGRTNGDANDCRLHCEKYGIHEEISFNDDTNIKCIYLELVIDDEGKESHKITTKYLNGDYYMRGEKE